LLLVIPVLLLMCFYIHKGYRQQKDILTISQCKFKIEHAKTQQEKMKGLSGRKKIDKKTGMLFSYNKPEIYKFWM